MRAPFTCGTPQTGEPLGEPIKLEHKAVNLDFTADGKRLALTDLGKNVTIWNVSTSKMVRAFKHDGPEGSLGTALSPDGKWFACKGPGGGLKVWDVDKGAEFRTFPVLHGLAWFSFSPDSARLAAAGSSGVVKTWDLATGRELWKTELPRTPARVYASAPMESGWPYGRHRYGRGAYTRCRKAATRSRRLSRLHGPLAFRIQPRWQTPGHGGSSVGP